MGDWGKESVTIEREGREQEFPYDMSQNPWVSPAMLLRAEWIIGPFSAPKSVHAEERRMEDILRDLANLYREEPATADADARPEHPAPV